MKHRNACYTNCVSIRKRLITRICQYANAVRLNGLRVCRKGEKTMNTYKVWMNGDYVGKYVGFSAKELKQELRMICAIKTAKFTVRKIS